MGVSDSIDLDSGVDEVGMNVRVVEVGQVEVLLAVYLDGNSCSRSNEGGRILVEWNVDFQPRRVVVASFWPYDSRRYEVHREEVTSVVDVNIALSVVHFVDPK